MQTILRNDTSVDTVERVDMLFDFIAPLAKDMEGVDADPEDEVTPIHHKTRALCLCIHAHDMHHRHSFVFKQVHRDEQLIGLR